MARRAAQRGARPAPPNGEKGLAAVDGTGLVI
jgi:hypothetical protein